MRGTDILAKKKEIPITYINKLPSVRAIPAESNDMARRTERKYFFKSELPALFRTTSHHIILGGDCICLIRRIDTTGLFQTGRALTEIVQGLALTDTWCQEPQQPAYTKYSPTGATRICRIFMTSDLSAWKSGIEILPAAFTDHYAVVLHFTIPDRVMRRRRGRWRIDRNMVAEEHMKRRIRNEWVQWRNDQRYYPMW